MHIQDFDRSITFRLTGEDADNFQRSLKLVIDLIRQERERLATRAWPAISVDEDPGQIQRLAREQLRQEIEDKERDAGYAAFEYLLVKVHNELAGAKNGDGIPPVIKQSEPR